MYCSDVHVWIVICSWWFLCDSFWVVNKWEEKEIKSSFLSNNNCGWHVHHEHNNNLPSQNTSIHCSTRDWQQNNQDSTFSFSYYPNHQIWIHRHNKHTQYTKHISNSSKNVAESDDTFLFLILKESFRKLSRSSFFRAAVLAERVPGCHPCAQMSLMPLPTPFPWLRPPCLPDCRCPHSRSHSWWSPRIGWHKIVRARNLTWHCSLEWIWRSFLHACRHCRADIKIPK